MIGAGGAWQAVRPTLVLAILLGAVLILAQFLARATEWIRTIQAELVSEHVAVLVYRQSIALDLAFYDSSEYYDHLHRARAQANFRPVALLESLGTLLQNSISLVALAIILIPYGLWVPVVLFVGTLPTFFVMLRYSVRLHEWRLRVTADERRARYYDWLLTSRGPAAELRLFRLGDYFRSTHRALRRHLRDERLDLAQKQGLAELGAGLVALLITGLAMFWMIWMAIQGLATLGDLTLFYQSFTQGQAAMRALLGSASQMYAHSLYVGNLFTYLDLQPTIVDPPAPSPAPTSIQTGIRFRQVSFHYPGSERAVFENFDLTIPAGKIVAIVGDNGAGKSTLIKLLCRLYEPDSGSIELDGLDIQQLRTADLQRLITALFQEPVHYQDTVRQNIAIGDLNGKLNPGAIKESATAAGADKLIARLPKGFDNLLGKWFEGGTELSSGEWQSISLARAFLRQAPIIVLDEPTGAMDPWAEIDWLDRFRELAQGRTAIVITHRFTTARYADVIHVMQAGCIVESGTHDDLLSQGGRYAEYWRAQDKS
jgi:ATP-binding cassette subfamily B protein